MENKSQYSCCFTGYRPHKFPFPFNEDSIEFKQLENDLISAVFSLPDEGCYTFYTGAAMGFDILAAETVLLLREANQSSSVSLISVVPFLGQSDAFPDEWKERYNAVLKNSDEVITLSEHYFRGCYQRRNEYMVNHSDFVITWYDGQSGGTKNTLCFAERKNKRIINLNGIAIYDYSSDDYDIIEDE